MPVMARDTWTDERLDDFSKQVEHRFDQVDQRFERVEDQIRELRTETKAEFRSLRQEMNARFDKIDDKFERIDARFDDVQRAIVWGAIAFTGAFIAGFAAMITLIATQL